MGRMLAPMLSQFSDGLKVNSHQLFSEGGDQLPINANGAQRVQPVGMPGMGGGLGGLGGLAGLLNSPPPPTSPVTEITDLQHLESILAKSPGVIIDFWSPTCPPCMRIKPTFEAVAKANEVDNLRFVAVNTQLVRDVAMRFQITSIPQFHAFVNQRPFKNFKGADEAALYEMVSEVADQVSGPSHRMMQFKQFKPMNLAPTLF